MNEFIAFVVGCLLLVVMTLASGYIFMAGWNMAAPQLFGLPEATFGNGCGVAIMALALSKPSIGAKK